MTEPSRATLGHAKLLCEKSADLNFLAKRCGVYRVNLERLTGEERYVSHLGRWQICSFELDTATVCIRKIHTSASSDSSHADLASTSSEF